ncbi:EpsG family protein [Alkalihalobacillus pseudalcaliphilus]|uniref:EpsG family protein n=1 Tax=Alkalihalobacillus pseudalcaliphilus TaxID=79884 RepID=UPI00064E100A|nr:EpsG family protein [Alkalihalobacillus pseudalcaliphilus]KMK75039.1 capsular biosynthesis protein [Alkalihalobacillus pseudalcaliphilus]
MAILWMNLTIVSICAWMARYLSKPLLANIYRPVPVKPNIFFALLAFLSLVLVSGLRQNIGDTYVYRELYEQSDWSWEFIVSGKDIGFGIFQLFLRNFSEDAQLMIFMTALITNGLIVWVLYKYARVFELSLYVYITSGLFLVSMNGIRQFLAAAIIFAATKFIFDGNWKGFTIVVLIAATIHQSALLLIPIYFLVRRKAWTKVTFVLLGLAILCVFAYNQFSDLLFAVIEDSQYAGYADFSEGGANLARVAVYSAPLVLAYLGRHRLRELFPNSDYIVNLCLLNVVFMIIASQNWIFARLNIYFGLYQLILLAWIVKIFKEKDQKLIYFIIVLCYLFFFYQEHVVSLNIRYRSDFLSLLFR